MKELNKTELTGNALISKIEKSKTKDIRELAILCGYGFESLDVNGSPIIKIKRKKFIQSVIDAGGDVDLFWLNDPYDSQRRYQAKNKHKKIEAQRKWAEKNKEKIKEKKQSEEYKQKNRTQALVAYHQRKNKEKVVDKIFSELLCEV